MSSYAICQFFAAPGLGVLSDYLGRRPILLFSLLGSVIGYILLGLGGSLAILFLGRIAPIKNLEVAIRAIKLLEDKKIVLEIVGPHEFQYLDKLKSLVSLLGLEKRVKFTKRVYKNKAARKPVRSQKRL